MDKERLIKIFSAAHWDTEKDLLVWVDGEFQGPRRFYYHSKVTDKFWILYNANKQLCYLIGIRVQKNNGGRWQAIWWRETDRKLLPYEVIELQEQWRLWKEG